MKRKIVSFIVCVAMLVSIAFPVSATGTSPTVVTVSDDVYLEMTTTPKQGRTVGSSTGYAFTISQYENDALVQTVSGETYGENLYVANYNNGNVVSREVIDISERVISGETTTSIAPLSAIPASVTVNGSLLGYITYKPALYSGEVERIQVFNYLANVDNEPYTINGNVSDTLAVITGFLISVVFVFLTHGVALPFAEELAITIISSVGGSIAGGEIGKAFSKQVAVMAYHYEVTGYDYQTNRTTNVYEGIARKVTTHANSNYGKWFYEGITPSTWQDTSYAYWFWCDLFDYNLYSGVASWS